MFKQILAATLSFCIILTLFCGCSTLFNSGKCGKNVVWELDDEGTLTISGSGEMNNYKPDGLFNIPPWQYSDRAVLSVDIKDGVTSIGDHAFDNCLGMESVSIADSVQSLGENAFCLCLSLERITIPKGIKKIGAFAFWDCYNLTDVVIENGVTDIGHFAFAGCRSMKKIVIPGSVKSIAEAAFSGCSSLSNVYYLGTQEQWKAISIDRDNEYLTGANILFKS